MKKKKNYFISVEKTDHFKDATLRYQRRQTNNRSSLYANSKIDLNKILGFNNKHHHAGIFENQYQSPVHRRVNTFNFSSENEKNFRSITNTVYNQKTHVPLFNSFSTQIIFNQKYSRQKHNDIPALTLSSSTLCTNQSSKNSNSLPSITQNPLHHVDLNKNLKMTHEVHKLTQSDLYIKNLEKADRAVKNKREKHLSNKEHLKSFEKNLYLGYQERPKKDKSCPPSHTNYFSALLEKSSKRIIKRLNSKNVHIENFQEILDNLFRRVGLYDQNNKFIYETKVINLLESEIESFFIHSSSLFTTQEGPKFFDKAQQKENELVNLANKLAEKCEFKRINRKLKSRLIGDPYCGDDFGISSENQNNSENSDEHFEETKKNNAMHFSKVRSFSYFKNEDYYHLESISELETGTSLRRKSTELQINPKKRKKMLNDIKDNVNLAHNPSKAQTKKPQLSLKSPEKNITKDYSQQNKETKAEEFPQRNRIPLKTDNKSPKNEQGDTPKNYSDENMIHQLIEQKKNKKLKPQERHIEKKEEDKEREKEGDKVEEKTNIYSKNYTPGGELSKVVEVSETEKEQMSIRDRRLISGFGRCEGRDESNDETIRCEDGASYSQKDKGSYNYGSEDKESESANTIDAKYDNHTSTKQTKEPEKYTKLPHKKSHVFAKNITHKKKREEKLKNADLNLDHEEVKRGSESRFYQREGQSEEQNLDENFSGHKYHFDDEKKERKSHSKKNSLAKDKDNKKSKEKQKSELPKKKYSKSPSTKRKKGVKKSKNKSLGHSSEEQNMTSEIVLIAGENENFCDDDIMVRGNEEEEEYKKIVPNEESKDKKAPIQKRKTIYELLAPTSKSQKNLINLHDEFEGSSYRRRINSYVDSDPQGDIISIPQKKLVPTQKSRFITVPENESTTQTTHTQDQTQPINLKKSKIIAPYSQSRNSNRASVAFIQPPSLKIPSVGEGSLFRSRQYRNSLVTFHDESFSDRFGEETKRSQPGTPNRKKPSNFILSKDIKDKIVNAVNSSTSPPQKKPHKRRFYYNNKYVNHYVAGRSYFERKKAKDNMEKKEQLTARIYSMRDNKENNYEIVERTERLTADDKKQKIRMLLNMNQDLNFLLVQGSEMENEKEKKMLEDLKERMDKFREAADKEEINEEDFLSNYQVLQEEFEAIKRMRMMETRINQFISALNYDREKRKYFYNYKKNKIQIRDTKFVVKASPLLNSN